MFCCTPKSRFAEFCKNLEDVKIDDKFGKYVNVLRASEEFGDEFSNVSTDVLRSGMVRSRYVTRE